MRYSERRHCITIAIGGLVAAVAEPGRYASLGDADPVPMMLGGRCGGVEVVNHKKMTIDGAGNAIRVCYFFRSVTFVSAHRAAFG